MPSTTQPDSRREKESRGAQRRRVEQVGCTAPWSRERICREGEELTDGKIPSCSNTPTNGRGRLVKC